MPGCAAAPAIFCHAGYRLPASTAPPPLRERLLPILGWLGGYRGPDFAQDATAGAVTAVLLVPQSMAYAVVAGLPPQVGLYASVLPVLIYALLGSSRVMAVGPVAVAAVMVAHALATLQPATAAQSMQHAMLLALMVGGFLCLMGLLRLGALVNLFSHPVLAGFTSGAAVMIILTQIPPLLGLAVDGALPPFELVYRTWEQLGGLNATTTLFGLTAVVLLALARAPFLRLLTRLGTPARLAVALSRAAPLAVVVLAIVLVRSAGLDVQAGVAVVGDIPAGLPLPDTDFLRGPWLALMPSAALIAVIAYVESVSVSKVLANRRRETLDANQEFFALGAANLAAAFSAAMPVAGSFSRSMVNHAAGARTQMVGVVMALLVAAVSLAFTEWFYHLPKAILAAVIVVAVSQLIDFRTLRQLWGYDRWDAGIFVLTFGAVLAFSIEVGLVMGVFASLALFFWRAGTPHLAVVGRLAGSEHFRNVVRHPQAQTWPHLLFVRIDRSLIFANASFVENFLIQQLAARPEVTDLVLLCSGINQIDASAVEMLERFVEMRSDSDFQVHLAEVKGPVMDRLERSALLEHLSGEVFLSAQDAVEVLTDPATRRPEAPQPPYPPAATSQPP